MIHHILHHLRLTSPQRQYDNLPSPAKGDTVSLSGTVPCNFWGYRNLFHERFQRGKRFPVSLLLAAVLTILPTSCTDLTFSGKTGQQLDTDALYGDPVIYLSAANSPDGLVSISLDYGEGSATKVISAVSDKPVKLAANIRLSSGSEEFVESYSEETGIDYTLLPAAFYDLSDGNTITIDADSENSKGNTLTVYSKNLFGTVIDPGRYLLPLVGTSSAYEVKDNTILVDVTIREPYSAPEGIELYNGDKMFTVFYLNTAEFDPRLACEMILWDVDGEVFSEKLLGMGNIIVLRSTMLSYDENTGKVGLEPSTDMRYVLNHYDKYVRPVQDSGRKVLLCIDGGGKGVGFCNFTDAHIEDFVMAVKRLVDTYGLDGVNLWDRNSAYDLIEEKGLPEFNTTSYPKTIKALKEALGQDRIVAVTDYKEPTEYFHDVEAMGGIDVGQYIDYAWHGYFDNSEPVQIVDPWHQDASMVSTKYPRQPITGLSPERYGCVHVTSYPSIKFDPEDIKIREWIEAGLNANNIFVYYDIHSNNQDEYEGVAWGQLNYVLKQWFDNTSMQIYFPIWQDNVDQTGYNAWVKDW